MQHFSPALVRVASKVFVQCFPDQLTHRSAGSGSLAPEVVSLRVCQIDLGSRHRQLRTYISHIHHSCSTPTANMQRDAAPRARIGASRALGSSAVGSAGRRHHFGSEVPHLRARHSGGGETRDLATGRRTLPLRRSTHRAPLRITASTADRSRAPAIHVDARQPFPSRKQRGPVRATPPKWPQLRHSIKVERLPDRLSDRPDIGEVDAQHQEVVGAAAVQRSGAEEEHDEPREQELGRSARCRRLPRSMPRSPWRNADATLSRDRAPVPARRAARWVWPAGAATLH